MEPFSTDVFGIDSATPSVEQLAPETKPPEERFLDFMAGRIKAKYPPKATASRLSDKAKGAGVSMPGLPAMPALGSGTPTPQGQITTDYLTQGLTAPGWNG